MPGVIPNAVRNLNSPQARSLSSFGMTDAIQKIHCRAGARRSQKKNSFQSFRKQTDRFSGRGTGTNDTKTEIVVPVLRIDAVPGRIAQINGIIAPLTAAHDKRR